MELAVGTSIERGLAISDNPDNIYVGTDLPEMTAELKDLFHKIDGTTRHNHYLQSANVLSCDELMTAASHFGDRRDLLVVHEGLWMYLTTDERGITAENIRRVLEKYDGVWVTPDIGYRESSEGLPSLLDPETENALQRITQKTQQITGRNLDKNIFSNEHEALRFFDAAGFEVTRLPLVQDVGSLSSIPRLWGNLERRRYEDLLKRAQVWVMRLKL